nr:RusA family crossover junction endodeoxyribonuclease [Geodermatophilus normandii]
MAPRASWAAGKARLPGEPLLAVQVAGRPSSCSTAATAPWKQAVRAAIEAEHVEPTIGRFAVSIGFRTPVPRNSNEAWDLDNLVKATLDAMEGVFGHRPWAGPPQPADDRVDYLVASKRTVAEGEEPGVTITVHIAR